MDTPLIILASGIIGLLASIILRAEVTSVAPLLFGSLGALALGCLAIMVSDARKLHQRSGV